MLRPITYPLLIYVCEVVTVMNLDFDYFGIWHLLFFLYSHPDVMMESYVLYGATPIFFVIFLILTLYFAANVVSILKFILVNLSLSSQADMRIWAFTLVK